IRMRRIIVVLLLTVGCLSGTAAEEQSQPITASEARAARLRPAGEWLTYEPTTERQRPLVDSHPAFSGDVRNARRLFQRDWARTRGNAGPAAGPDFDASTCGGCHIETTAGRSDNEPQRIARPIRAEDRIEYGNQITTRYLGHEAPEARLHIDIELSTFTYDDGTTRQLVRPIATAAMRDGTEIPVTLRVAPLLFGWGLLESIDPNMLGHFHDPEDANGDGISGINRYDTGEKRGVNAALGWKADHRHLHHQITAALLNDMGVESGATLTEEITPDEIAAITDYVRSLGAPNRRHGATDRGRDLFGLSGCANCHITAMLTREDTDVAFADQLIWPYSDFMLHDMGPKLADAGDAPDASEWRTAPLWGVGYAEAHLPNRGFLHDGRARDIEEAVLWHGGEAAASVSAFAALSAKDRAMLLSYVRAL
ncbi:MAG: di-heme oxidoredictase family protein, partial [Pseudomonadota bacterium]